LRGFSLCESNVYQEMGNYGALLMSDRKALAREIAARTTPRFIEINKEEKTDRRPIMLWPDDALRKCGNGTKARGNDERPVDQSMG
jgi:hypothetical protein